MQDDPYELLGIGRDATPDEIRAAYQRLAKTFHPDAGGGADVFAQIVEAQRLLLDPERRERYDRTGEVDERRADNAEAAAMDVVASILELAIEQADLERDDVISGMRAMVAARIREIQKSMLAHEAKITRLRTMSKKIRRTKKGGNLLRAMLKSRVDNHVMAQAQNRKAIQAHERAQELLEGYEFDRGPEHSPADLYRRALGIGTSMTSI